LRGEEKEKGWDFQLFLLYAGEKRREEGSKRKGLSWRKKRGGKRKKKNFADLRKKGRRNKVSIFDDYSRNRKEKGKRAWGGGKKKEKWRGSYCHGEHKGMILTISQSIAQEEKEKGGGKK